MIKKNLEIILKDLKDYIVNNENDKDIFIIKRLYNSLQDFNEKNIILEDLENIKKDVLFLETTHEKFSEISNYFDPLYITTKNLIHKKEVIKLREENKKRRGVL